MAAGLLLLGVSLLATPRAAIADTGAPGTQDTSFTSSLLGSTVFTLQLESLDGVQRLVAGGDLFAFDLLFSDGSNDNSLAIATFGNITGRIVYTAVPETVDGTPRLLVGGLFGRNATDVKNKLPGRNIIRLLPNLSLDDSFDPGTGANGYVTAILPVTDGIIVGGQFDQFNKVDRAHLVKLTESGSIDPGFNPSLVVDNTVLSLAAQQNPGAGPNGQIVLAGTFSQVGGATHNKLARLNADGTVDGTFNPTFDNRAVFVTTQADGKILVGGDFEHVNGLSANHIVRLNVDGSVDTSFVASVTAEPSGFSAPVSVYVITPLADGSGRMYLGGNFAQIDGVTRNFLGRINADGSLDTSFDPGKTIINSVEAIAEQPLDNRVLIGETRSQKDSNGKRPASLIRLYGDPIPTPTVGVTVTGKVARQKNTDRDFIFTRVQNDLSTSLTVHVTQSGTAPVTGGKHYKLIPALTQTSSIGGASTFAVTFPANIASVAVEAHPTKKFSGSETVTFTVQPDPSGAATYVPAGNSSATITLKGP